MRIATFRCVIGVVQTNASNPIPSYDASGPNTYTIEPSLFGGGTPLAAWWSPVDNVAGIQFFRMVFPSVSGPDLKLALDASGAPLGMQMQIVVMVAIA